MFTLGNKEAIINSSEKFPVTVTTPPGTTSLLTIKGFGAFDSTHIIKATAQRFIAGRNAGLSITAPDAAALGILNGEINIPVIVHIRVNTSRFTSEWATDFIKRGRPFIFEILVNGGETPTQIMTKLVAVFSEYIFRFNLSNTGLPFTWTQTGASVSLVLKDPYLSFQNNVVFLPRESTYGVKAVTVRLTDTGTTVTPAVVTSTTITVGSTAGLRVGDTVVAGANTMTITDIIGATSFTVGTAVSISNLTALYLESQPQAPTFDGKYLEENVRFSNEETRGAYAISPDEYPKITGNYTSITFEAWDDNSGGISNVYKPHTYLGTTKGDLGEKRKFLFTLYFLEGTNMFTDAPTNKVHDVLQFLLDSATLTNTKMYIANGNTVETVTDFLANAY